MRKVHANALLYSRCDRCNIVGNYTALSCVGVDCHPFFWIILGSEIVHVNLDRHHNTILFLDAVEQLLFHAFVFRHQLRD